jgi:hypothetical protein
MKTNNDIYDKQLQDLFKQVALDVPSSDFTDNLMERIKIEDKRAARKRACLYIAQIAAGVSAILLIPGLVIHFVLPDYTLSLPRIECNVNFGHTIVIGLSVLFLLILDTLLKKRFYSNDKD